MRPRHFWIALFLTLGGAAANGYGAVELSSLNDPTLATLVGMGSTPVAVGPYQFSNFAFTDASSGAAHTSAEIQVQGFGTNGFGLQFVSNWFAANGTLVDDVISYDVKTSDPASAIGQISLLSNGTAPVPASGTFTTSTLISSPIGGGTAAPLLSTYNDGVTSPVDTTKADINFALESIPHQLQLHVIDTFVAVSSTNNGGGVATASVLQNAFIPASIPEPTQTGWIFLPMAIVVTASGRRWRASH
jgi:hypothetical protein